MSQSGVYQFGTPLPEIETITGNVGGAVSPDGAYNIDLLGAGVITVTGNAGTNTLTISSTGNIAWSEVVAATLAMNVNTGYILNRGGGVVCTLPAAAALGDVIMLVGKNAGLYSIAQRALQTIHFGAISSTTGVGGSVTASATYDSLELVCITANTDFLVRSSIGAFVIV